jgi:hypothetical protein
LARPAPLLDKPAVDRFAPRAAALPADFFAMTVTFMFDKIQFCRT